MNDNIDLIILTINNANNIDKILNKIELQKKNINKIIIMNTIFTKDEKSNLTSVIEKHKKLNVEEHLVIKSNYDHGKTRNEGAKYSKAEYVMYMTDDAIPYDEYLVENLYEGIKNNINVAASYAKQIAKEDATFTEKKTREFNYGNQNIIKNKKTESKYGIKNYFLSNVCSIYDKKIFDKFNGFDEGLLFNEDTLYAFKAINSGYNIFYNAKAKVLHSHNLSFMEQYNRNKLIGISQGSNEKYFANLKSENEGFKFVKYMTIECIKNIKIISLIKFYIECLYRYKGYKDGKKIVNR